MENSKIEWTDHTFNPWIGCQHVSPGCDHCYAEAMMDHRYGKVEWGPRGERKRTSEAYWKNPVKWNANARAFKREHGHRPRVFCASLADVFDNQVSPEWRRDLFALIRECPRLDWLILTKRPQNITKMLPSDWGRGYQNGWLGVTAENHIGHEQFTVCIMTLLMVIGDALRRSFSLKGRTFMTLKSRGNFARLQKYVSAVDPEGHWRGLEYGGKQYRTDDGVVVNWWKASGNILFQGRCLAPLKFKQAFIAVASTKGRLEDEDGKSPRDLGRRNETLRPVIADVLLKKMRGYSKMRA